VTQQAPDQRLVLDASAELETVKEGEPSKVPEEMRTSQALHSRRDDKRPQDEEDFDVKGPDEKNSKSIEEHQRSGREGTPYPPDDPPSNSDGASGDEDESK